MERHSGGERNQRGLFPASRASECQFCFSRLLPCAFFLDGIGLFECLGSFFLIICFFFDLHRISENSSCIFFLLSCFFFGCL